MKSRMSASTNSARSRRLFRFASRAIENPVLEVRIFSGALERAGPEHDDTYRDWTMSAVIEMFRRAAPGRFSCPMPVWELLWELGHAFGWQPKGTTYVMSAKSTVEAPALRNYEPGESQDHKQVEAEDAVAWAHALEVAKASPHVAAMIQARSAALLIGGKPGAELLPGMLDEFIEFAYGGAFEFAISNEDSRPAESDSGR
jgi:hypothetical protein